MNLPFLPSLTFNIICGFTHQFWTAEKGPEREVNLRDHRWAKILALVVDILIGCLAYTKNNGVTAI